MTGQAANCADVRAALAHGGGVDWRSIDGHLESCTDCSAGLLRLTAAIDEQFAASNTLDDREQLPLPTSAQPVPLGATPAAPRRGRSRWSAGRWAATLGGLAAALILLIGVATVRSNETSSSKVTAERRSAFVPNLYVLPDRPDHTYYGGEYIQVCLSINQPSRVHLSVLAGHTTFDLYDADSDPGQHCFPEQIGTIQGRATLRVEVFYGSERVAREDFPLLAATPSP